MLEACVELCGPAVVARQREHTRMLPGAVRVDRRKPHAASLVVLGHTVVELRLGAPQQLALRAPDLAERLAHASPLLRLARLGRPREPEAFAPKSKPLGP